MLIFFKIGLLRIFDSHIPSKTSSSRFTHPWISTKTRRLSRRKARAYRKAKSTNNKEDWIKYKSLNTETQREMRRAHQVCIQDTVNQDLTSNSKRFYSYVKSKRQETTGISPLLNQDGFLYTVVATPARLRFSISNFNRFILRRTLTMSLIWATVTYHPRNPSSFPPRCHQTS